MEDHRIKINQLITNKKNLIDKCKTFVVEIKTLDGDGRAKLQELTVHAKQIIEQDKKLSNQIVRKDKKYLFLKE